jgi:hemoglobin/transferrin/lactoferrin receptor protein
LRFGVFNLTDKKYWEWSDVRGVAPTSLVLDRYTRPGINAGASFSLQF